MDEINLSIIEITQILNRDDMKNTNAAVLLNKEIQRLINAINANTRKPVSVNTKEDVEPKKIQDKQ